MKIKLDTNRSGQRGISRCRTLREAYIQQWPVPGL